MDLENEDLCDLDNSKVCDSCEKCLDLSENDYMEIKLDGLIKESEDFYKEYEDYEIFDKKNLSKNDELDRDYEFIEDHKELREEYNKNILEILSDKE